MSEHPRKPYATWYEWRTWIDENWGQAHWLRLRQAGFFSDVASLPKLSLVDAPPEIKPDKLVGLEFPQPWPRSSTDLPLTLVMPPAAFLAWLDEMRRIVDTSLPWRSHPQFDYYDSAWDGRWLRFPDGRTGYIMLDLTLDGNEAFAILLRPIMLTQLVALLDAFVAEQDLQQLATHGQEGEYWMQVTPRSTQDSSQ